MTVDNRLELRRFKQSGGSMLAASPLSSSLVTSVDGKEYATASNDTYQVELRKIESGAMVRTMGE